jgi:hypothetical protein
MGSYAGWFKQNEADLNIHYLIEAWPNDGVNNRFFANKELLLSGMDVNGSPFGTGIGDDRWKCHDSHSDIDFTQWNFIRWTLNFNLANFQISGGNFSSRYRLYVNEVFDPGGGFSAPPFPASEPPNGPCLGPGLYTGPQRLCLGGNFNSSNWNGQIGPFYVADETTGAVTTAQWQQIMDYRRPA